MAGLRKRGSFNGLAIQPGATITYKQDGSLEGVLVLEGDAAFRGNVPQINQAHPDDYRALCYNCEVARLKSGKIRATAAYIGVASDPTPWFHEGQGSCDKESIVTHPNFVSKLGGTKAAPLNGAKFDEDTEEFLGFPADAGADLAGVDSWFIPSVVYRFTRWTYRLPDFNDLGTIDTPPVAIRKPATVRNFLAGSGTYRQIGTLYQVTIELWGSGKKGWNPLIYQR